MGVATEYTHTQCVWFICDNVSNHKTQRVRDFLVRYGNVRMHFTPTYSSWLNQAEDWFSRIQRDVIACGAFTSGKDLGRNLMRYIREHHKNPKPIKWKYDDPSRRIRQGPIQSRIGLISCCLRQVSHLRAPWSPRASRTATSVAPGQSLSPRG